MADWREDFIARWGKQLDLARDRIELMQSGRMGTFDVGTDGKRTDTTAASIAREIEMIDQLAPLVTKAREELGIAHRT